MVIRGQRIILKIEPWGFNRADTVVLIVLAFLLTLYLLSRKKSLSSKYGFWGTGYRTGEQTRNRHADAIMHHEHAQLRPRRPSKSPLSPAWLWLIDWNICIDARTKKNARFLVPLKPISEVTHVQTSPNIWMSLIHVNARGQVSSWQGCDGTEFTVFTVPPTKPWMS